MAITVVGTASNQSTDGSDVVVNLPAMLEGDVVYVVECNVNVTPQGLVTTGYTNIFQNNFTIVFRKVMGSTPDTTVVGVGAADGNALALAAIVLRGVISPYEDVALTFFTDVAAAQPDSPSITPITQNALILSIATKAWPLGTLTGPSGYGNVVTRNSNSGAFGCWIGIATKFLTSAVAEDPPTWTGTDTASGATRNLGVTIAVRSTAPDKLFVADKGSYTIGGKPASLLHARIVAANVGTYTISGKDVNLSYAPIIPPQVLGGGFFPWGSAPWGGTLTQTGFFVVSADKGTYTVTGQPANLIQGNVIVANAGSYAISGKVALLRRTRVLIANAGAYVISGNAATFVKARTLVASAGAYSVVGKAMAFNYQTVGHFTLIAGQGAYLVSGKAAGLVRSRILTANTGAYSVSGKAANILLGRRLFANAGSYNVVGQAASLVKGRTLQAAPGAYAVNGQIANLLRTRILSANAGAYNVTGQAANLVYVMAGTFTLVANAGAYLVSGKAASFISLRRITANTGSYLVSGKAAGLTYTPITPPPERVYTPGWEWQAYDRAWDERRLV